MEGVKNFWAAEEAAGLVMLENLESIGGCPGVCATQTSTRTPRLHQVDNKPWLNSANKLRTMGPEKVRRQVKEAHVSEKEGEMANV